MAISLDEVRRRILIALFSDDELMNVLVLKGGNALAIVHKVGSRASLDMDFSIKKAFDDLDDARTRIFAALDKEFGSIGYVVFDKALQIKPSNPRPDQPNWWGGYAVQFKLIERGLFDELSGDLDAIRKRAEVLGPLQKRIYTIDISQGEFCEGKLEREIDDYTIYVYSLEMIAIEKLRAICQQMPEYDLNRTKSPRARDFYDIHQIIHERDIDLSTDKNIKLLRAIFSAKGVSLQLLEAISSSKVYHELDWPSVEASIEGKKQSFDYYSEFVSKLALQLYALREE